jgi:glutathione S-transferase
MSLAILRLLEEHLYWTFMYARWGDNQSWEIVKDGFFGKVALPAKWVLPNYYRKKVLNQIYETGIGHHSAEEIYDFGKRDIDAVAILFSQDDYFFGPRPSSLDAAIFGIFCNIIYAPLPNPLSRHTERYPQLKTYCDRILETYYQK